MAITIKNKTFDFPIYLPDATRAVVKSLDSLDLINLDVRGVVVNTYHLMNQPGLDLLEQVGGIKNFMNYQGLVVSDSGGWQVFSLIHRSKRPGKITDEGVKFNLGGVSQKLFTPEISIQTQFAIGSDIIICLDDFTDPLAGDKAVHRSVQRTIDWAKRSKEEYLKQLELRGMDDSSRPHLYAVIQGGFNKELRKYCAEELVKIGFDGYGFGGYVVVDGELDKDISKFIADLIPNDKVKFALGVGTVWQIADCYTQGWQIFDCTLPTRDARHKRLYTFKNDPAKYSSADFVDKDSYSFIYIDKMLYKNDSSPISEFCDCQTCKHYSKSYLYHLFKTDISSAFRLATIHNLRTYNILLDRLRHNIS